MAFTEVTSESWFSRIGKSLIGILAGIAIFLFSIGFLWWNEGHAVKTEIGLKEGAAAVINLPEPTVNAANDQKLVHLTGMTETDEPLRDPELGLEAEAIQLKRQVEMYQWQENSKTETRDKIGGGTEKTTTYSYSKTWSESPIDSSGFRESGHDNPGSMPISSQTWTADPVTVGDFTLSAALVSNIDRFEPLAPPVPAPAGYTPQGQTLFRSTNPSSPQIGDLRITFKSAKPAEVSIAAAQNGTSLGPFTTSTKTTIEMLDYGKETSAKMFADEQTAATIATWLFRAVGLIGLIVACALIFAPIGVIADVLPFLGSIARFGTFLLSLVIAIPVAFITMALAWVAYRPVIGISLLLVAVVIPVALLMLRKKKAMPAAEHRMA